LNLKFIDRFKKLLLCILGLHKWILVYSNKYKESRYCVNCKIIESSMYDMAYGGTYWTRGNLWINKIKNFVDEIERILLI